jgi:hypothetical protein
MPQADLFRPFEAMPESSRQSNGFLQNSVARALPNEPNIRAFRPRNKRRSQCPPKAPKLFRLSGNSGNCVLCRQLNLPNPVAQSGWFWRNEFR